MLAKAPATITYEPMTQFVIPTTLYYCSGFLEASCLTLIYTHHRGWQALLFNKVRLTVKKSKLLVFTLKEM